MKFQNARVMVLEDIRPLLCDRHEAARLLNVSISTVGRMLQAGELPRIQIRGRVRIPIAAVKKIAGEEKVAETA